MNPFKTSFDASLSQIMRNMVFWQDFGAELMESRQVFSRNRVIFFHRSKRNIWAIKWYSELPSHKKYLSHQTRDLECFAEAISLHGIRPPFFIQTRLQQYSRGAFLYSAYSSFSNPICFRSVWCRRAMIPGKIFTSFAKFQGIVSVNDVWFPRRLQELH